MGIAGSKRKAYWDIPAPVDILADSSVHSKVTCWWNLSCGNSWQVSGDVKGEASKLADVHTLSLAEIVVKIGNHGSPDDQHLQWGRYLIDLSGGKVISKRVWDNKINTNKMIPGYREIFLKLKISLTCDFGSRGYWLGLVLSVGTLCFPGYLFPCLRMLHREESIRARRSHLGHLLFNYILDVHGGQLLG